MSSVFLAEWWDIRDLGNPVARFLELIDDAGGPDWVPYVVSGIIGILAITGWLVTSQLAFVWIERRLISRIQVRVGPNRVGPMGLLQPVADAIKLLTKEAITVNAADRWVFWLAPSLVVLPALLAFAVIP